MTGLRVILVALGIQDLAGAAIGLMLGSPTVVLIFGAGALGAGLTVAAINWFQAATADYGRIHHLNRGQGDGC